MRRSSLSIGLPMCLLSMAAGMPALAKEPIFRSNIDEYDEAYLKAVHVVAADIKNGQFVAGESWDQVWTRDSSYSIDLACGLLQPEVSKRTLTSMVEEVAGIGSCWYQDTCGHFGGWPVLTDAIVGATGAWALYEVLGDRDFLAFSYKVTSNSLRRAERDAFDEKTGLFKGCASFMESNSAYPKKYAFNGPLLAETKALSTNLLYYNGYKIAARMGRLLHMDSADYETKARALKAAINSRLWLSSVGYYTSFLDENDQPSGLMEGTGESFALLFGVADPEQKQSILRNTPVTPYGIGCLWPRYPEWMDYRQGTSGYYHDGMIWPFVQGYWAWAAAANADVSTFERELKAVVHLSQANDTFMEFYRPENGLPDGSRRQLWSASGYLAMIYHGLFGMEFGEDGLHFSPTVPAVFANLSLHGLVYRGMLLNVDVRGSGAKISSFAIDGKITSQAFLPVDLVGTHDVSILLK